MKNFYNNVQSFIRNRIEMFILMPEKEKTAFLLKRYGINTLFTQRGRSWISKPGLWVLSEAAMFEQLNCILLDSILSRSWVFRENRALKALLCFILGLPHGKIMSWTGGSRYYNKGNLDSTDVEALLALSDICFFAGFANRKTLLNRFYKSNAKNNNGTVEISFDYPFIRNVHINFLVRMAPNQKLSVENHINFVSYRREGVIGVPIKENSLLVSKCQF